MTNNKNTRYGSDLMAELIANLDIPFIALNPGASFRGLHDSLINHPHRDMPELITCTHEEISVDIAHGYAKATGKVMAAAIHNVVGLQHATMAIYDAWCDRVPMMLFGGTGPMPVEKRRPGSDWLHTALVQGNLVRDFVKWDDQPASVQSLSDSVYRAHRLAVTEPAGPVYVCFDAMLQEAPIEQAELDAVPALVNPPGPEAYSPGTPPGPSPDVTATLVEALEGAKWPVIIADYTARSDTAFHALAKLADEWAISVIDQGSRFNMATDHPMNLSGANFDVLERADVVLALDMKDLYGSLSRIERTIRTTEPVLKSSARVFAVNLMDYTTRAWSADFQRLYPTEMNILADTQVLLPVLLDAMSSRPKPNLIESRRKTVADWHASLRQQWKETAVKKRSETPIATAVMADELWNLLKNEDFVLANGSLRGWVQKIFTMTEPRQYLGASGGGGLGYGIGATIGACLAHRNTGKIVLDIQSDGDLLFTPGGLWTLAHHELPALIVMFNNRSYYNSEEHQINIARHRGRNVERTAIGTTIVDPPVDFAAMAESMGVAGIGPIENVDDIAPALQKALAIVKDERRSVLVDVVTQVK
jgi:thiamine pyrophosphate-dependent acetolactate synthase large subunit-like protein